MLAEPDLLAALPRLLLKAIAWAEEELQVLSRGRPLDEGELALARAVEVRYPEVIRSTIVASLPLSEDAELQAAALQTGLRGPEMMGVTLGYGIYIATRELTARLISHECRRVAQYESAGSIAAFLPTLSRSCAWDIGTRPLKSTRATGSRTAPEVCCND